MEADEHAGAVAVRPEPARPSSRAALGWRKQAAGSRKRAATERANQQVNECAGSAPGSQPREPGREQLASPLRGASRDQQAAGARPLIYTTGSNSETGDTSRGGAAHTPAAQPACGRAPSRPGSLSYRGANTGQSSAARPSRRPGGRGRDRPGRLACAAAAALLCWLLAAGPAGAYQLTNNLIANNLPPKFVQAAPGLAGSTTNSEIVVRVKEGPQSIGKLVYTLKGEDPDEDPLTFGVLGTMASDLLRVENVPGNQANVYLRKELDRETTESHQVVITLTDGKLGRGNWVEDVNDNYPVFGPHRTAISIREDARAPTIIETIEATDADEGRFGQVVYKLDESAAAAAEQPGGDPAGRGAGPVPTVAQMFQIETVDGKGVISLVGQLDFEQRSLYQLRVLAIDRAQETERLSASTSILVSVEDCEDQPPMFTFAPSITRIPEDLPVGSAVVRVSAADGDRGVNNPIKYSLLAVNNQETGLERNLFSIGSDSGQISVAHELDRELTMDSPRAGAPGATSNQPGAYVLQVRATEVSQSAGLLDGLFASGAGAANSVTTELTVILVDVNDELPTFNQDKFYGELLENSPAESLVSFVQAPGRPEAGAQQQQLGLAGAKVFDRDQGTNGTFTLHLEGEHGHLFDVWPSEATNEATLMIKVAAGALQPANAKFFDFEANKELRLSLVAREKFPPPGGGPRRQSSAELTVQLRDTNDNYPQFDTDLYRVEIPENAIRGMHICAVKATDLDSGALGSAGVRYTEIRGERANKFKLDPLTGVITLKTNEHGFDREQTPQHHLIVEARDNLGLGNRNTTQLVIVLTDVNDQRPKFLLDQYEAFIYENELDFQSPLQVQAADLDAANTQNSRLTYSIVAGDSQRNFTIDPATGRIRVRATLVASQGPAGRGRAELEAAGLAGEPQDEAGAASSVVHATGLDFERISQKRDETRQFNLTVKASDNGLPEPLSSTTQVLIVVYDKNDHAPVFSRPVYARSIREDAPGGSAVIQVQAQDGDHSPVNSKITYRISSGASDKFVIDSDSGLISVANGANLDIDRVQGGGQRRTGYLLNVLASDGSFGQNQKSTSALVNITIIDVNNKAPEFVPLSSGPAKQQQQQQQQGGAGQLQVVFVNEDAPYGLIVTRVFATDLDSSAELRFSINYARSEARNEDMLPVEPAVYRDVFAIDPIDGTIKVNKQLDRELFDQVKLRLQVEDLAAQTADQVAHSHLLVRITDVNDNRPTFKRPVYKAVVNENSISGTSVVTMAADDRDLNKTLRYSLEASSPELARLVRINPRSGEVTVNDKIDRELFPLINVTVKAEDFGQPHPLTGSAQLVVTVRDENDNNPIFLNATHLRPIQARSDPGPPANQSAAGPNNHNMHYRSSSGASSYRLRSLGPHQPPAGRFSSAEDHGQPPTLELTDGFGPHYPETSYFGLVAAPSDENGRELALLAPGATAQVREDASPGHQIAYVRAEDADVGNNGRVTYLLDANSSGNGKFRIDRDSGILSVAQPLDRESQKIYTLIIEACDNFDLGYSTGESRRAFTQVNLQVTDINDNAPTISTNLNQAHSSPSLAAAGAQSSAAASLSSPGAASNPTYEDALNSPGPYDLALSECLSINEFQAPNEPILVVTATDPDDPETPNGQIDLAIMNNPHQNEMFALVPVRGAAQVGAGAGANLQPGNEPVSITTTTGRSTGIPPPPPLPTSTSGPDLTGFEGEAAAASSAEFRLQPARRRRSVGSERSLESAPRIGGPLNQRSRQLTATEAPPSSLASAGAPLGRLNQAAAGGELQMHLVLRQSLKEKVGNYSVLVRASDRGAPALSTIKLINVCVQDVNNHAPVFTRPPLNHTIRIMENATVGSFVTQVEAADADHGLNGELQYSLKPTNIQNSNNDWQSFKIDRLSGAITTTKPFNRQVKKYYTLRVQAQDFGRPTSLSSDIDINIMIVNSGKYQPEFEQQHQTLQFTENVTPGTEWFKLLQTTNLEDDPALIHMNQLDGKPAAASGAGGANGNNWMASPCYYIVDGDDYEQVFHLDRYTHKLTNQKELDREKRLNYTLVVQASNNCNVKPAASQRVLARALEGEGASTTTASSNLSAGETAPQAAGGAGGRRSKREAHRSRHDPPRGRSGKRLKDEPKSEKLVTAGQSLGELGPAAVQALDALVAGDKSLLKVTIKIKDVNDNAPKFTQRIYTGGITTEADFGTVFMIVQAIDADSDANGQVTYSIVKPIKRSLSLQQAGPAGANESDLTLPAGPAGVSRQRRAATKIADVEEMAPSGPRSVQQATRYQASHEAAPANGDWLAPAAASQRDQPNNLAVDVGASSANELGPQLAESDDLFVVHAQTGEISLNFDPQKQMKGYFEFEILAKDSDGLSDSARVLIYLLRQDQRVKFVLRLTPQELRRRLNRFRSVFGNITGALVNIDSYKYFENHDGTVDKKKTSLFLHFVQPEDNTIIDVDKVLTLIDNNIEYLDELYKEFHVLSSEAAHLPLSSGALVDPIDQVRTSLMGVSSFLALILVLVIALCLNQRTRYERQLKAAAVSAFGGPPLHLDPDFHSTTNLPNTNLHSQDPNPIWMSGQHYAAGAAEGDGHGHGHGHGHWMNNIAATAADCANKKAAGGAKGQQARQASCKSPGGAPAGKPQKLFHSASSGVGMTLDDDDDVDGVLDELSSSGDQSDMNSLHGVANHQHHYGAATEATATPRDSLNSSHGQVSSGSSSGANSASTTNERQVLCSAGAGAKRAVRAAPARGEPKGVAANQPRGGGHQLNGRAMSPSGATLQSVGNNSTFGGAYKEVTIYTEHQPRPSKPFEKRPAAGQPTSQVGRLATQFSSSRLQQVNQQHQRQFGVGPEAPAGHKPPPPPPPVGQPQRGRTAVHSNGASAEHGIIKTAVSGPPGSATTKQLFNKLDAKFVPANEHTSQPGRLASVTVQQQEQSVSNFETSLSKLSILNLETTEL